MALLTPTITEEQLLALFAVCPPFDPQIELANAEIERNLTPEDAAAAHMPDGYRAQPSIGFDFIGFNGQNLPQSGTMAATDLETIIHLNNLQTIVADAQTFG
jgi:hypothetical protein